MCILSSIISIILDATVFQKSHRFLLEISITSKRQDFAQLTRVRRNSSDDQSRVLSVLIVSRVRETVGRLLRRRVELYKRTIKLRCGDDYNRRD